MPESEPIEGGGRYTGPRERVERGRPYAMTRRERLAHEAYERRTDPVTIALNHWKGLTDGERAEIMVRLGLRPATEGE